MSDIIDINVNKTVEEVTINVVDNLITVNINNVTGGGGGSQTLQEVTDEGNVTTNDVILNGGNLQIDYGNGSTLQFVDGATVMSTIIASGGYFSITDTETSGHQFSTDNTELEDGDKIFATREWVGDNVTTPTLAETLIAGNETGGTDIVLNDIDAIALQNGSHIRQGTIDAGNGGAKGISQICAVGYEHKWEAGRLYIMNDGGTTIREVSHNFAVTPTGTDDVTKGFLENSRWILDNGDVYVCSDPTEGEAVWDFITGIPTLQQVLDNDNSLSNGRNFQGNSAGGSNTGNNVNGFGTQALQQNDGNDVNGFGNGAGYQAEASHCNYFGAGAGALNVFENVNLFGRSADADADNQTVFVKYLENLSATYQARLSFNDITADRKYELPDADGTIALLSDITSGGVTSVGLSMPSAFSVTNSPITSSGDISVTGAGLASQYIRGDGTLATLPTSASGGSSISYYLNGGTAASVATYYQMSKTAVVGTGVDFSKAGNGLISQWLTDVADPNRLEITAGNWNFEMYMSASSSGGTPAFYVELLKYDGTTFTTISNSSAVPEAITSGTTIDLYLTSLAIPQTTLLVTDRLAIRVYIVNSTGGRTITMHTQDSHLCQIITNFAGGVTSLNGLTANTQNLAVGTSGSDFNISSVTDIHTFNLPTASASNRGALSSADWSTFNGKQAALSYTPYKFIQTSQTAHTGTVAETIIATATIAGGTFNSSDVMKVIWQLTRPSGGVSGVTFRLKINTSNTLTGATLIATNSLTTVPFGGTGYRTFTLQGGNLIGFPAQNALIDASSNAFTAINTAYNTANVLYVFFTLQSVLSTDSSTLTLANITN